MSISFFFLPTSACNEELLTGEICGTEEITHIEIERYPFKFMENSDV